MRLYLTSEGILVQADYDGRTAKNPHLPIVMIQEDLFAKGITFHPLPEKYVNGAFAFDPRDQWTNRSSAQDRHLELQACHCVSF